jgi:hypothetical protein
MRDKGELFVDGIQRRMRSVGALSRAGIVIRVIARLQSDCRTRTRLTCGPADQCCTPNAGMVCPTWRSTFQAMAK